MKERAILFSAPMVRAILEGRKTQTRRVVKPQPPAGHNFAGFTIHSTRTSDEGKAVWGAGDALPYLRAAHRVRCPYGQPGDQLWVRETFAIVPRTAYAQSNDVQQTLRADDPYEHDAAIYREGWTRSNGGFRWHPSIHMPRWASRITLEIVSVRVERLNDIGASDAIAEGIKGVTKDGNLVKFGIPDADGWPGTDDHGWPWREWQTDPVIAYRNLWESINGQGAWDANPWVWVIEFRAVTP